MVGDGTAQTAEHMKQRDLHETVTARKGRRAGVRASIVAMKRRNGRGAKGGREVEAKRKERCKTNRRQCLGQPSLNKPERSLPGRRDACVGCGPKHRSGRIACWQLWKQK